MCGIVGVVHLDGRRADRRLVRRMLAPVRHRGPDAHGAHVDRHVALGHARLAILDLAGGRQPMSVDDGDVVVAFNGEIFNYIELRQTLLDLGHPFATRSDTEVLLRAYLEYGTDCVEHFNGQWAFAIWDRRRGRLFLSRDRLGIRPLFFTQDGGKFLFASEIKSLLADADVPRRIDPVGLAQTFTFWSTLGERTVFEGIRELPPGTNLTLEGGQLRLWRYWQLDYRVDERPRSVDDWADELLALLTDAARLRLRSDVPVGAYLSGGLDSTVNTALIQRASDAPPRTFSITFDDAEFDESAFQREAVEALGTDHQAIRCTARDIGQVFPDVVWHAERPVLRTAPAPLFLLSRLVRDNGYKVVLTGEGADEMLGGYDLFKEAKVRRFWATQPESAWRPLLLRRLYPYLARVQANSPAYQQAFFHVRPGDLANPLFSHLPRWEMTSRLATFYSAPCREAIGSRDVYADCQALLPDGFDGWPPFCQAQFIESSTLLPGYILSSQGDRMAMAHSVEGRFPFLDHRVAEFAARVPPRLKMKGLCEKYLLKRAVRGLVPESIIHRTKQPYRAPDSASFFPADGPSPDYVEAVLAPGRIRDDGLFEPEAVARLVAKARAGRIIGFKDNMALVGILSTQLLIDRFVRNYPAPAEAESTDERTMEPLTV
ncbi:MAG: asparagine synthase (glutamine-hydrolyzing) [Pirellulales bacterium]|nr:asparagine synthase (glutamine-hydrolyzing) [Pirellulales bacterium]